MNLAARLVEGFEEAEPLDVVHVEVGQEDVHARNLGPHARTETPYPRPGIEDQESAVSAPHLDARGIPARRRDDPLWQPLKIALDRIRIGEIDTDRAQERHFDLVTHFFIG